MVRPRTATAILELRGSYINHAGRRKDREHEPRVTTPLPTPPKYFDTVAAAMWTDMASRGQWLTSADQWLVEIAATLMKKYRANDLAPRDVSQLIGVLAKIGFSKGERDRMALTRTA